MKKLFTAFVIALSLGGPALAEGVCTQPRAWVDKEVSEQPSKPALIKEFKGAEAIEALSKMGAPTGDVLLVYRDAEGDVLLVVMKDGCFVGAKWFQGPSAAAVLAILGVK